MIVYERQETCLGGIVERNRKRYNLGETKRIASLF